MLLLHRKLFQKTKGGGRYGTSLPGSFSPWFLKKNKTHLILLTDQIWVFVCFYFSGIWYLANVYCNNWANLKKLFVSYHLHHKKKVTRATGKTFFFTWFKLNITFSFKCYLHHNCNINLNWNNAQFYGSAGHKILLTLKRCITLSLKFLDKVSIVLWLLCLRKHFSFIWRQYK